MRPKSIMLLVVALGCGLVAAIGIRQIVSKNAQASGGYETTPVFVAMKSLSYGDKIIIGGENANVKLEPWPSEKVPESAITDEADIKDRSAGAHIPAGAAIFDSHLQGAGGVGGVSAAIPPGFRAYALKGTSDTVLGDMLRPAHRVDVMVYVKKKDLEAMGFPGIPTQTLTILANIKVLAINDQTNREQVDSAETSVNIKSVTLLVERKQAERLAFAGELGKIRLVLRGEGDEETISDNDSAGRTDIFGILFEGSKADEQGPSADEVADPLPSLGHQPGNTVEPEGPKPFEVVIWSGLNAVVWVQDMETKRMRSKGDNGKSTNSKPTTRSVGVGAAQGQKAAAADLPQGQVDLTDLVAEEEEQKP